LSEKTIEDLIVEENESGRQDHVESQRYKKGREKETCEIPQRKKRREEAEKGREGLSPCRTGMIGKAV
jgi:hypothetical protein